MTVQKLVRKLVRTQYDKHDNTDDAAIAAAKRLLKYMHDQFGLRDGLLEEMLLLTSKQVIQEFESGAMQYTEIEVSERLFNDEGKPVISTVCHEKREFRFTTEAFPDFRDSWIRLHLPNGATMKRFAASNPVVAA